MKKLAKKGTKGWIYITWIRGGAALKCLNLIPYTVLATDSYAFSGAWDVPNHPFLPEGNVVEKTQRIDVLYACGPGSVSIVNQVYLVRADLFRPKQFWRLAEITCIQTQNAPNVVELYTSCQILDVWYKV